jgi:peroxiredoxin
VSFFSDYPHVDKPSMSGSNNHLAIGHQAPAFEADAVVNGAFKTVKLSDYKGKYFVLFFYPLGMLERTCAAQAPDRVAQTSHLCALPKSLRSPIA